MRVEYEEKTFESYFNAELDRRSTIYFPLGQVQEGSIGADVAVHTLDVKLWEKFGLSKLFLGIPLSSIASEMESALATRISAMPPITTNLLVQYKRPELITSSRGAEWIHWGQQYFRYTIDKNQQGLLSHVQKAFENEALVMYASPAIKNVVELVRAKLAGKIIDSTNFRPALDLDGHQRNTYVGPGSASVACSEPRFYSAFDPLAFLRERRAVSDQGNLQAVIRFASGVEEQVQRSGRLRTAFRLLMDDYRVKSMNAFPVFRSMMTMSIFRELTGAQWLLHTGPSPREEQEHAEFRR